LAPANKVLGVASTSAETAPKQERAAANNKIVNPTGPMILLATAANGASLKLAI